MTKRCKFCGRKLDEKEHCQNAKCPEHQRIVILMKQEAKVESETKSGNNS